MNRIAIGVGSFIAFGLFLIVAAVDSHAATTGVICKSKKGVLTVRTVCLKGEIKVKNLVSFKGNEGPAGAQGPVGLAGPTGAAGTVGASGGTITGVFSLVTAGCLPFPSGQLDQMNGMVGIVGTSLMARFGSTGRFTIYNVPPGTYSLTVLSMSSGLSYVFLSFPGFGTELSSGVTVTAGQTTDLGTVSWNKTCCGNNVIDTAAGEVCDGFEIGSANCLSETGEAGGFLMCNSDCTSFYTGACGSGGD